jgi:hypothetical protein
MSSIRQYLGGIHEPMTVERLEAENGSWINFSWSTLGTSGAMVHDITTLYSVMRSGRGAEDFLTRTARTQHTQRLGRGFSGNGDALGFAYTCHLDDGRGKRPPVYAVGAGTLFPKQPDTEPMRPGPCITGIIDMRATENVRDGRAGRAIRL